MKKEQTLTIQEEAAQASAVLLEAIRKVYPKSEIRENKVELRPDYAERVAPITTAMQRMKDTKPEGERRERDVIGLTQIATYGFHIISKQHEKDGITQVDDPRKKAQLISTYIHEQKDIILTEGAAEKGRQLAECDVIGELMAAAIGVSHQYAEVTKAAAATKRER